MTGLVMQNSFKVRASSWGELFDCAYKWEGKHLLGLRMPSGPAALLGTSIHAGTAAFDIARMEHQDITADEAAGVLVDTLRNPEFEVDWSQDDSLSPKVAEATGISLLNRYCTEVSPRYHFTAVELTTKPLTIDCGNGVFVTLTGQLDRMRLDEHDGCRRIADLKTGGAAVEKGVAKTKGHRAQLGTYELLSEHTTGQAINAPAEVIGMKTKGTLQIATGEVREAKALMVGTEDHRGLIQFAADMFRTGLFPPNPQSLLCSPKYCPRWATCPYHE